MNSKTKYPVTDDELRTIFREAGLGAVSDIEMISDGWYNNVLSVTAGGADYVIKIAPEPGVKVLTHEKDLMARELRFIALLEERATVRVPKVYAGDLSRTLIPCDYFIMEKLGGKRLDKAKIKADEGILNILDEFHAIEGTGFGYEQMGLEPNWYKALRKMTQALVDDCAYFKKPCPIGKKLLKEIDRHRAILEQVPSVLVNFDLHSMNLFYDRGELTVIDLERCFWGDWVGDYVYRESKLPQNCGREEKIRLYLLMGYLTLIMYTEKYSRYKPWNKTWWADVAGTIYFGAKAFTQLKKLGKRDI